MKRIILYSILLMGLLVSCDSNPELTEYVDALAENIEDNYDDWNLTFDGYHYYLQNGKTKIQFQELENDRWVTYATIMVGGAPIEIREGYNNIDKVIVIAKRKLSDKLKTGIQEIEKEKVVVKTEVPEVTYEKEY
jgi:hypothetical protein